MNYPGNAALSIETRQRLLTTFEQTLDLAQRGNRQEALLGCDFILRMDPLFEPARTLLERLNRGDKSVEVGDLRGGETRPLAPPPRPPAPKPTAPAVPAVPRSDAEELSFADLDEPAAAQVRPPPVAPAATPPPAPLPAAAPDGRGLAAALQSAVAERRFPDALALAGADHQAVAADPELRRLAETAQSALEAEPYVRRFLDGARAALDRGRLEECERLLQKARALDAGHPELLALARRHAHSDPARTQVSWRLADTPTTAATPPSPPPGFDAGAAPVEEPFGELTLEDSDDLPSGLSLVEEEVAALEESVPLEKIARAAPTATADAEPAAAVPGEEPASEPPALTVDLPEAAASADDPRIAQLLAEGQAAFERGEHQAAVDAWSRIFLIDIDHAEAARRIEQARKLKAEAERKLEEIFHDGLGQVEAGDLEGARANFARLLELQPNHLAAREQLQEIDSGEAAAGGAGRAAPARELGHVLSLPGEGAAELLKEEILIPPEPGAARPRPVEAPPVAVARSPRRTFLVIGSLVLVVAAAGGWLLWSNRDRLFPNSRAEIVAPAPAPDPIARATRLHEEGKTAIAISQLRRLPPNDPQYDRAQALVAQWEVLEQPPTPAAAAPAPEVAAQRDALVAAARQAHAAGEHLRAVSLFDQAAAVAALDGAAAQVAADARRQVQPLAQQIELFRSGEWEYALPALWRLREEQPQNRDVARLIVDSYYNLGVRDLQREDPMEAAQKFKEALLLAGGDAELERLSRFAETYRTQPQDLLYRTYVKYLPFR